MRLVLSFTRTSKLRHLSPNCFYCTYIHFFKNIWNLAQIPHCSFTSETGTVSFFRTECCQGAVRTIYKMTQRKCHAPCILKPMKNNYESKLSLQSHFNSNFPPTQGKEAYVKFKSPKPEIKKASYEHQTEDTSNNLTTNTKLQLTAIMLLPTGHCVLSQVFISKRCSLSDTPIFPH